LALIVNPMFIYLSYTFMSDVFYLGMLLLSLSFYVRGIKSDSARALWVGSVFAAGAYLSRQLGVVLPIAAAAALILKERRLRWKSLVTIGALPAGVIVVHTIWLLYVHGLPWGAKLNALQNSLTQLISPGVVPQMIWRLLIAFLYLGIFTLPIFLAQFAGFTWSRIPRSRLAKLYIFWLVLLGSLTILAIATTGRPMPYLENTINRQGIGALTLAGHKTPVTPDWVFWLVTFAAPFAGAAQGAFWTHALLNARRESAQSGSSLLIASLLMAGLTALLVYLWDEYLLVFIPASLYLVLRSGSLRLRGWLVGLTACAAILAYDLVEMSDYMAWNSARWAAGEQLVARGVPPGAIDGGLEWVGWHEFETALPLAIAKGQANDLFAWMSITPKRYTLAFEPLTGYNTVNQVAYRVPVLDRVGHIYVLERAGP
jgi:hypothetical protein